MITDLFTCVGVEVVDRLPFCKAYDSKEELLADYIKYCPKSFSFNDLTGEDEENNQDTEDHEPSENEKAEDIAAQMQRFLNDLSELTNQPGKILPPALT